MTTLTANKPAASNTTNDNVVRVTIDVSSIIALTGRGKAQREAAYAQIAPLAFVETLSRSDSIENIRIALGKAPKAAEIAAASLEWKIGRVAAKLPLAELKGHTEDAERIAYARDLIMHHAMPDAKKVSAKQKGRRTVGQHKAIRAADSAWSLIAGEIGIGMAETMKAKTQKAADKRAPQMAGSTNKGKAGKTDAKGRTATSGVTPTHNELVKAPAPMTTSEAFNYLTTQAATLAAFCNKNAKLLPTAAGQAVLAFRTAINAAAQEYAVAKAEADGIKAETSK